MRVLYWFGAVIVVMALSSSAKAQVTPNTAVGTPLTTVNNTQGLQFVPVSTGGVIQNPSLQAANMGPSLLTKFWNWLGLGSSTNSASVTNGPVMIGQSIIPPAQYPTTFAPLPPINSTVQIFTSP